MQKVTQLSIASLNSKSNIKNINPVSAPASENKAESLAATLIEFEDWRRKKATPGEAIPDTLWDKLFQLAEVYSPIKIRSMFNISNKQYQKKFEEKFPANETATMKDSNSLSPHLSSSPPNNTNIPPELCEVKIKSSSYQAQSLPNAKTMVVEFHREDGRRMILHITQDAIPVLLQDFFKG